MFIKLTKHADIRIQQRVKTKRSIKLIKKIFKKETFIPIGYDLHKKNIKHCLFYVFNIKQFFVACVDENTNEMLTILFGYDFRSWNISSETFDQAKLKAIDSLLQSNINLPLSSIELNLMKKNIDEFHFIRKYFEKNGFKQKEKKNKIIKKQEVNFEEIRLKQKKLREENINSFKKYKKTKEDEDIIQEYKNKSILYEEENRIKYEKIKQEFINHFNIELIEVFTEHFLCKFKAYSPNNCTDVFNLFEFFNPDLIFKVQRFKNFKNNIKYLFNKEETELLAKQYIILKNIKGYNKTINEYLIDCGFGMFNNNIYIQVLDNKINKINKNFNDNNFDKTLERLRQQFLNKTNKFID